MQRRRCLAMPGSAESASVVTSVVSNTIQRVLQSPVVLTKKAKAAKAQERAENRLSVVEVTHSKADSSKGDRPKVMFAPGAFYFGPVLLWPVLLWPGLSAKVLSSTFARSTLAWSNFGPNQKTKRKQE